MPRSLQHGRGSVFLHAGFSCSRYCSHSLGQVSWWRRHRAIFALQFWSLSVRQLVSWRQGACFCSLLRPAEVVQGCSKP